MTGTEQEVVGGMILHKCILWLNKDKMKDGDTSNE